MLVKWDVNCIKVIPTVEDASSVILVPGYNEVVDAKWQYARPRVMKEIESGKIVEEWTKINAEQKADFALVITQDKGLMAPAKLKDIQRPRVKDVVKSTYHIATLERWLEEELRADVRIEILRQLSEIDKVNTEEHKKNLSVQLERVR
jgi:hypothetical protein